MESSYVTEDKDRQRELIRNVDALSSIIIIVPNKDIYLHTYKQYLIKRLLSDFPQKYMPDLEK